MKSLVIKEKLLGTDHPKVAISLNNIGLVYMDLKKYDESLKYLTRSYEIKKKNFGEDH